MQRNDRNDERGDPESSHWMAVFSTLIHLELAGDPLPLVTRRCEAGDGQRRGNGPEIPARHSRWHPIDWRDSPPAEPRIR
jgi:hypothetical protein